MNYTSPNLIVTAGDHNYIWGIYLLVASMRQAEMPETVAVYLPDGTPEDWAALNALGGVVPIELPPETAARLSTRSLTCAKPTLMTAALAAAPEGAINAVSWVDSDAFFHGSCSALLPPSDDRKIHVRRRSPAENCNAFRGHSFGEDGSTIPAEIIAAWRNDLVDAGCGAVPDDTPPRYRQSCSACILSVPAARRDFLAAWERLMNHVIPEGNIGVVDHRVKYYHQLDESTLNATLTLWADAPEVDTPFRLDKDREHLFVHFIGVPKPWQAWAPGAMRHYDAYVSVLAWAQSQGLPLPGKPPASLLRRWRFIQWLLQYPRQFCTRAKRFIKRHL